MRLLALALTSLWIELLPSRTPQNVWASTLTGFRIEDLCRVGTLSNLIGTLAVTSVLIEH